MEHNNKLIAEFMGVNLITIDDIRANKNPYISSADGYTKEDLQYHSSWDWLMPVIHRCFDVAEDGQMSDIMHYLQVAEMGDTYNAVIEFIKDQNTIKNN